MDSIYNNHELEHFSHTHTPVHTLLHTHSHSLTDCALHIGLGILKRLSSNWATHSNMYEDYDDSCVWPSCQNVSVCAYWPAIVVVLVPSSSLWLPHKLMILANIVKQLHDFTINLSLQYDNSSKVTIKWGTAGHVCCVQRWKRSRRRIAS